MADVLGLLGLCRRAGQLTIGDEAVSDLCKAGQAKLILLSADAGESTAKRARRMSEQADIPLLRLSAGREELGAALGRGMCAVCAVSDAGFAAASWQRRSRPIRRRQSSWPAAHRMADDAADNHFVRKVEVNAHEY